MLNGSLIHLTEDFSETLQIALFEMETEKVSKKEEFISSFKIRKNKIWKIETNLRYMLNSLLKPVKSGNLSQGCVMLGRYYGQNETWKFLLDYERIIWVTYREDFRSISEEKLINSDMGWGCTIRVGQMILLECLRRCLQIPEWQLLWMIQENIITAPYSIHKITKIGQEFSKSPGDWYSASNTAYILSILIDQHHSNSLKTFVSMNCTVYEDQIYSKACDLTLEQWESCCKCIQTEYLDLGENCAFCSKSLVQYSWNYSVFIQIPIMLGLRNLMLEYVDSLKLILDSELNVGIIGGKSNMALMIVGYIQDSFIVLDPHYVQKAPNSADEFKKMMNSYHCKEPMHLKFSETEGSFSLGFVVHNEDEWKKLKTLLLDERIKGIVSIQDHEPNIEYIDL